MSSLLLARHEAVGTFPWIHLFPGKEVQCSLRGNNISPSNDKLPRLKVHTINTFENHKPLTKLNFHLEKLKRFFGEKEPASVICICYSIFRAHSQVPENTHNGLYCFTLVKWIMFLV